MDRMDGQKRDRIDALRIVERAKTGNYKSKMVLMVLFGFVGGDYDCWPKVETIAERCEMTAQMTRKALHALEEAGFITINTRFDRRGHQTSNCYLIHLDSLEATNPAAPPYQERKPGPIESDSPALSKSTGLLNPPGESPKRIPQENKSESDLFAKWWGQWPAHPRKHQRRECAEHWHRQDLDRQYHALMASLITAKGSQQWRDQEGRFVPAPLVWLRKRPWEADAKQPNELRLAAGAWS